MISSSSSSSLSSSPKRPISWFGIKKEDKSKKIQSQFSSLKIHKRKTSFLFLLHLPIILPAWSLRSHHISHQLHLFFFKRSNKSEVCVHMLFYAYPIFSIAFCLRKTSGWWRRRWWWWDLAWFTLHLHTKLKSLLNTTLWAQLDTRNSKKDELMRKINKRPAFFTSQVSKLLIQI